MPMYCNEKEVQGLGKQLLWQHEWQNTADARHATITDELGCLIWPEVMVKMFINSQGSVLKIKKIPLTSFINAIPVINSNTFPFVFVLDF